MTLDPSWLVTMKTLSQLILITHPMAYHQLAAQKWARPWIAAEQRAAKRWYAACAKLPVNAAVAIVGCYKANPADMESVCAKMREVLGDRTVVLQEPEYLHPDHWQGLSREDEAARFDDLRLALLNQRDAWNKEEMETFFHSRRCVRRLCNELESRGMSIDASTRLLGWGVEFEGCTAKYALALRELLGLASPPELDLTMCVPGARFMLAARSPERIALPIGVTIYLADTRHGPAALFLDDLGTLRHAARRVRLPLALAAGVVRTKQNGRLWPEPQVDRRKPGPPGCHEMMQKLVTCDDAGLVVPVCSGMVYRLAKAPAYLFAPPGMPREAFRRHLLAATPA